MIRGQPELGRDPLEEPRVRLFDAPGLRCRHKLNGQAELGEDRLGLGRLIAGDAQSIAGIVQRAKTRDRIRIEVVRRDALRHAGLLALPALLVDIEVRAKDPERLTVVELAARDHGAADCEKRQPRDAEPVGPRGPRPRLIDESLADVEDNRPDGHGRAATRRIDPPVAPDVRSDPARSSRPVVGRAAAAP